MHECIQDERIRDLLRRVDKLEANQDNMKESIMEIKRQMDKIIWWIIATFGTALITFISILFNMLNK